MWCEVLHHLWCALYLMRWTIFEILYCSVMISAFNISLYNVCFHSVCFHSVCFHDTVSWFLNIFCSITFSVLWQHLFYYLLCFMTFFVLQQHLFYNCLMIFHSLFYDLSCSLTFLVLESSLFCDSICSTILLVLWLSYSITFSFFFWKHAEMSQVYLLTMLHAYVLQSSWQQRRFYQYYITQIDHETSHYLNQEHEFLLNISILHHDILHGNNIFIKQEDCWRETCAWQNMTLKDLT